MYKYCIKTKAARDYIIYIKLSCPELGHRIRIRRYTGYIAILFAVKLFYCIKQADMIFYIIIQ